MTQMGTDEKFNGLRSWAEEEAVLNRRKSFHNQFSSNSSLKMEEDRRTPFSAGTHEDCEVWIESIDIKLSVSL